MKLTVIGGKGFIGNSIVECAKNLMIDVFVPERNDERVFSKNLGHVIYCAGLTADYRQRPFDTIEAHVTYLAKILKKATFDSFLYLSSTRVYIKNQLGNESSDIIVNPIESDDLFNISKLMGESLCLLQPSPQIRVARLSNVYGDDFNSDNFLFSIIRSAVHKNEIILQTTLNSQKDYISINDVVKLLIKIAFSGKQRMYNVASGTNVSNNDIVRCIQDITKCSVAVVNNPKKIVFPIINIELIKEEFEYKPRGLIYNLRDLVLEYRNCVKK